MGGVPVKPCYRSKFSEETIVFDKVLGLASPALQLQSLLGQSILDDKLQI
jgi:hypothetical protein